MELKLIINVSSVFLGWVFLPIFLGLSLGERIHEFTSKEVPNSNVKPFKEQVGFFLTLLLLLLRIFKGMYLLFIPFYWLVGVVISLFLLSSISKIFIYIFETQPCCNVNEQILCLLVINILCMITNITICSLV